MIRLRDFKKLDRLRQALRRTVRRFKPYARWRDRVRYFRQLERHGITPHVKFTACPGKSFRVKIICRSGGIAPHTQLIVQASNADAFGDGFPKPAIAERLPVALRILSQTSSAVRSAWVNLDDIGDIDRPDDMTFCSVAPDALLIPDHDYFNSGGYVSIRHELVRQRPWPERQDMIVWRGSTTGMGLFPSDEGCFRDDGVIPRLRMCALLKSVPNVDAKIHRCVQVADPEAATTRVRNAALLGDAVPILTWLDHKFAIDIDGNSNAWSNLFTRLLMGCCVIKVASPAGFRQWYYDRIEPWEHFVPVRSDLGDLVEKVDWCRSHQRECERIAAAGQDLTRQMSLDSEILAAVERVNERLGLTGSA